VRESSIDRGVLRGLLAEAGVRPSKKLGQNFLADRGVVADIEVIASGWSAETIVEIGPGLGALTERLIDVARVIAVEVDGRLAEGLENRLGGETKLEVVHEDILRLDLKSRLGGERCFVVGSLPYRITAPILKWLIDHRESVCGAALITQREVAEKIAASPGKDGSALGILVRSYADVEIVRRVARGCFVPVPEVESTLWTLASSNVRDSRPIRMCFSTWSVPSTERGGKWFAEPSVQSCRLRQLRISLERRRSRRRHGAKYSALRNSTGSRPRSRSRTPFPSSSSRLGSGRRSHHRLPP